MQYSTIFRYLFLGIFNGFVVYLVPLTIAFESWFLLTITLIISLLVNLTYATNRLKPLKWITPGMIFLLSFVVFIQLKTLPLPIRINLYAPVAQ